MLFLHASCVMLYEQYERPHLGGDEDMEEATETVPAAPPAVSRPNAVYQRRLEKSKSTIETLQKGKAEMEKQLAELKEAERERMDEEAKAAKFSKIVENSSPGAVIRVGRQVIFLLFPCHLC
jgi:hypothetical protein